VMVSTQSKISGKSVVVTIDGPAGAGKSTTAKALAKRLGFFYLDTGAMYRALTFKAMRQKVNLEDEDALVTLAKKTTIDLKEDGGLRVFVDGEDVSEEIRTVEVTNNTFYIARAPKVREIMVNWQRAIGESRNTVVEGRDVGTVVFPKAAYKFYLDADLHERSKRRIKELQEKGKIVNERTIENEMKERDTKDLTRRVGPLKKAADAVLIDSTFLSVDQVTQRMFEYIEKKEVFVRHG